MVCGTQNGGRVQQEEPAHRGRGEGPLSRPALRRSGPRNCGHRPEDGRGEKASGPSIRQHGILTSDFRVLARNNLLVYSKVVFPLYQAPAHLVRLGVLLQKIESGEIKRLIISMPPRHGKSQLCSINFPAWYLGLHPDKQIICASYSQEFGDDLGRKVRDQILSSKFGAIFPQCLIREDSNAVHRFNTGKGGAYYAVGIGGPLTGRGSNILLIDDPLKNRMEAESAAHRKMMREWYQSTAFTRLEPRGAVVIVMTRWREDDLIGFVLKEQADEEWVVVNMSALNDNGEALWPERYPVDQLLRIRAAISSYDWQSMYQQTPTSREGNILKREWWRFYDQLPPNMDVMIQSWDMNFKEGASNSFVVGQVWGRKGPNCYLIHQYRGQIGFTDTLRQFESLCRLYPSAYRRLVENKANGPAVIDVLKRKFSGIIPVEPEGSKEARVHAVSATIESGNVYLPHPRQSPWVAEFIEEASSFPNGQFSDQVDAMSQGLSNLGEQYDGVARLERLLAD